MWRTYLSAVGSGAIWIVFGALQFYFRHDEFVVTDVSTWNLFIYQSLFLIVLGIAVIGWGVHGIRSRTRVGDEELRSAVVRVPLVGGEYVVTDDVVYHRSDENGSPRGVIATLRHLYRYYPRVVSLQLVLFAGVVAAGLGMATSGLVVEVLPFGMFLPFLYAFVGSALMSMATLGGFALWQWIAMRRRLPEEVGTANRTYGKTIPVDAIEFVAFDRHLGRPAIHVKHRQADADAVQVAYLWEDASEQLERAESAFHSLGVPVQYFDDPFPPESPS